MKTIILILQGLLLFASCSQEKPRTASELLDRSIEFHDPDKEWENFTGTLTFREEREGGTVRNTQIWIDNPKGFFKINRNDTEVHGMVMDSCFVEKGEVDCLRAGTMRDYYLYLWGLPMKLRDPGTVVKEDFEELEWEGNEVYSIGVDYEKDAWTFYIDRESGQLVGYEFVKPDGSGEYIVLEELTRVGRMRLPDSRSWYTLEGELLGTDKIVTSQID